MTLLSFQAKQTSKSIQTKALRTDKDPSHSTNSWPGLVPGKLSYQLKMETKEKNDKQTKDQGELPM